MNQNEELISGAFETWFSQNEDSLLDYETSGLAKGFKAAFEMLLPILERLKKSNDFYADERNYSPEYERQGVVGRHGKQVMFVDGGKLARGTKKFVEDELKKIGGRNDEA